MYNSPTSDIRRLLDSLNSLSKALQKNKIDKITCELIICDNSKTPIDFYNQFQPDFFKYNIVFRHSKKNLGYGLGHNSNFLNITPSCRTWFIALNPDIYFKGDELVDFFKFLIISKEITCAAPLIFLPNGEIQYSAKFNPTVTSLLVSRFSFLQKIKYLRKYLNKNQNRSKNYKTEFINTPFLSGCFLVFPSNIYKQIGGFSKKYFLHFEDADIVRRCNQIGLTVHCPNGIVTHVRGRGSHKSISQQFHLIISFFKYSLKWGIRFF